MLTVPLDQMNTRVELTVTNDQGQQEEHVLYIVRANAVTRTLTVNGEPVSVSNTGVGAEYYTYMRTNKVEIHVDSKDELAMVQIGNGPSFFQKAGGTFPVTLTVLNPVEIPIRVSSYPYGPDNTVTTMLKVYRFDTQYELGMVEFNRGGSGQATLYPNDKGEYTIKAPAAHTGTFPIEARAGNEGQTIYLDKGGEKISGTMTHPGSD